MRMKFSVCRPCLAACFLAVAAMGCELMLSKPRFDGDAGGDPGDVAVEEGTAEGDPSENVTPDVPEDPADADADGDVEEPAEDLPGEDPAGDDGEIPSLGCDGLVLLMHFDKNEALGETVTRVRDFSGTGNDGWVTGAAFDASAGRFDGAYRFDGEGDIITVNHDETLDMTDALTIAAWVFPENSTGFNYVLNRASADGTYPYLHYGIGFYGDTLRLRFVVSSMTQYQVESEPLEIDQWVHVVGTFDLNGPDPSMRFYVDGELVGGEGVSEPIVTNAKNLIVGGWEYDTSESWIGVIDELAVFNRALGAGEVRALYLMTTPIPCDAP
jgi:hypothetical protein